jgi:hypothetical protein
MATIDAIFDTNVLVHVVQNLKAPSQFLTDLFFPNVVESNNEFVSIDVDVGLRRMSPFVSPLVEGKPVEGRKIQTNTFRPPYIKDLRTPDFRKPVLRAIGERIGGNLTPEERIQINLAFEMTDQVQMIDRRIEWMAAQACAFAQYTVAGDGVETSVLNFNRDPLLTVDISSGAGTNNPWLTAPTGIYTTPSQNIEVWSQLVLQKGGRAPTDIVFSTTAYNLFLIDNRVQQSVWYSRSGDSKIEFGGTPPVQGAVYKGTWGGYNLWVYNDWYVDQVTNVSWASSATTITIPAGSTMVTGSTLATTNPNGSANGIAAGTTVTVSGTTATLSIATTAASTGVTLAYEAPMLPPNYILMGSRALEGVRAFGCIYDEDFAYAPMAYAPKTWVEKNPSRRHLLMQSSPLIVPSRVNALMSAKVA